MIELTMAQSVETLVFQKFIMFNHPLAHAVIVRPTDAIELSVMGDSQQVLLHAANTGGVFTLIRQKNAPGFSIPTNRHELHDEINYVLSGRVVFTLNGAMTTVEAGDAVFVPRGVSHKFEVVGNGDAEMLLVLSPAGLERLFEELSIRFPNNTPFDPEGANSIAKHYFTTIS